MSSALLVLQLFLCSISTSISNVPTGFPTNIVVQAELRATVAHLWVNSPTFRKQCLKIGEHKRYRVALTIEPQLNVNRNWRAQCVLRIYSSGLVTAHVTVPSRRDVNELIPHELEHVVEHIDGVNVKENARKHGNDAYDTGGGRIETARAMRMGRQVRAEVEAGEGAVAVLTRR